MIFILKESIMNGTVTLKTMVSGVEADTFEEAVKHLKQLPFFENMKHIVEEKYGFSYWAKDGSLAGIMEAEPLIFI